MLSWSSRAVAESWYLIWKLEAENMRDWAWLEFLNPQSSLPEQGPYLLIPLKQVHLLAFNMNLWEGAFSFKPPHWLASKPPESFCLCLPTVRLWACTAMLSCLTECWGMNSGPCAYIEITLPTKSSSLFLKLLKKKTRMRWDYMGQWVLACTVFQRNQLGSTGQLTDASNSNFKGSSSFFCPPEAPALSVLIPF